MSAPGSTGSTTDEPVSETALEELARLRSFASSTQRRHEEIRARLAWVDLDKHGQAAWDLGMSVLAILDGPAPSLSETEEHERRLRLLLAAIREQRGKWKTGRVLALYERLGYEHVSKGQASKDLKALMVRGYLTQHEEPGVRWYEYKDPS